MREKELRGPLGSGIIKGLSFVSSYQRRVTHSCFNVNLRAVFSDNAAFPKIPEKPH